MCSVGHCWSLQHLPGSTWSKLICLHVVQIKIYVYCAASRQSELSHDFSSLNRLRHRKDWNITTSFLVTLHGWHYSWLEGLGSTQTALVKWYNTWVTRAEWINFDKNHWPAMQVIHLVTTRADAQRTIPKLITEKLVTLKTPANKREHNIW